MIRRQLLHLRRFLDGATICYGLAIMMLLFTWRNPTLMSSGQVQDTLLVIDISESMNVRDTDSPVPQTPRLELAKASAREAMTNLACGSRFSMALFAGDDSLVLFEPLEICRHFPAMEQVVTKLHTKMRWIGDSRVEAGMMQAIKEAHGRQLNLIFITDGDEMPHRSAPRLSDLQKMKGKVSGWILGVGGEAPAPVPKLDAHDEITDYWTAEEAVREGFHPNLLSVITGLEIGQKAPNGALDEVGEHLSALRADYLKALAHAAGLEYATIKNSKQVASMINTATMSRSAIAERDARWLLSLSAFLLVLTGWYWQPVNHLLKLLKQGWRKRSRCAPSP